MINYFDLGVYDGEEMEKFIGAADELKVPYRVVGFEPLPEKYRMLQERYKSNSDVYIFDWAVADYTGEGKLYIADNGQGSSIYPTKNNVGEEYVPIMTIEFSDFISRYENKLIEFQENINILRFNIEGAEYVLMKDLIDSGYIHDFDLFLGAVVGADILKVGELKEKHKAYMKMLEDNNIEILPFCDRIESVDIKEELIKLLR